MPDAVSPSSKIPSLAEMVARHEWFKVIRPQRSFFDVPWREVWRYRDLTFLMAWQNIATYYTQTVLGPLWFLIQPLFVTVVFSYLFGRMAHFGSADIPHFLFYMGGLVPWGFFADSVGRSSNVFVENAHLFSKVYFPRLSVPLAAILSNVLLLAVQFCLFLVGLAYYLLTKNPFVHPNWWILATPLVFVQLAILALGMGCIVSALSRRFRDLALGVRLGLQMLMFGSAIVFPLSQIDPHDRLLFFLNPVVPPIEFFRYAFLGKTLIHPWHLALSSAVSVGTLVLGLLLFNRAEQNAMDTV